VTALPHVATIARVRTFAFSGIVQGDNGDAAALNAIWRRPTC
jgi:hypothetical protein